MFNEEFETIVKLMWVEKRNEWHLLDFYDRTIQEFLDCPTIRKFGLDPDKNKKNVYEITVRRRNA